MDPPRCLRAECRYVFQSNADREHHCKVFHPKERHADQQQHALSQEEGTLRAPQNFSADLLIAFLCGYDVTVEQAQEVERPFLRQKEINVCSLREVPIWINKVS